MQKVLSFNNVIHIAGNVLFFLLLLVMMLDPGNAVLRMKDILFILFFGFNVVFYKPEWKNLIFILPIYLVIFITFLFSVIQQNHIDYTFFVAALKGFAPLTLLLWIKHYDVLKLSSVPVLITCVVILILYSLVYSFPEFEYGLSLYSNDHNEMVMITRRDWLGFKILGMYYRSVVSFMPVFFYLVYQVIYVKQKLKWRYVFGFLLVFAVFLISGTRAMLLTPFAIMGVAFCFRYLKEGKVRYLLYPLFVFLACGFLLVIYLLATQEGDRSNDIKYAHLVSYAHLFNQNLEYLFIGQGPGTMFYTEGFGRMTAETEWTYLEVVRCYGLFAVVILAVYLYPLYCCLRKRKDSFMLGLAAVYFIFLMVGGTNPFLLNSQGMTMVWIMYSYISRNNALRYPELNFK